MRLTDHKSRKLPARHAHKTSHLQTNLDLATRILLATPAREGAASVYF
jgi:hypothetical protein